MPPSPTAPRSEGDLYAIQRLQFTDLDRANQLLSEQFRHSIPFGVREIKIVPRAVSLNSISGTMTAEDGTPYFFKTHVEPDSVMQEYYNVELLESAGYPIIRPVYANQEPGRQIVVYPFLRCQTLFDVVRQVENEDADYADIVRAQQECDRVLFDVYERTLRPASAGDTESPVHQLFYHRLAGPRFQEFYVGKSINLNGGVLPFEEIAKLHWVINGVEYRGTLADLIEYATRVLNPSADWGPTVVGHGDAHNGNLFYEPSPPRLVYFDPAFAGRHSPLLDLTKPLFHNVVATWMYFPREITQRLHMTSRVRNGRIEVTHDYRPSALREEILRSKLSRVLAPLMRGPYGAAMEDRDWRNLLKAALLCCPLLTLNLADGGRFPANIALLGLCFCVEVGSSARWGQSYFDAELTSALDG